MEVSGQLHASATLYPEKGGWVVPRAGLDAVAAISPCPCQELNRSGTARNSVTILTELPRQ